MMTLDEIFTTLLKEPLSMGLMVDVFVNGATGNFEIDLNTFAKSECILVIDKDTNKLTVRRRYDKIDSTPTYDDIIELIYECRCGRSYMNPIWSEILMKHDYI